MDSIEANTQFSQLLRNINPSVQSLNKIVYFAMKNWQNEDYLFPVILDLVNDANIEINTKSTIFQFIDVLVHESFHNKSYPSPYITNLQESLPYILLKVLPGSSNYNLYNVFNSLRNISRTLKVDSSQYELQYTKMDSDVLTADDLQRIDANLPYPDIVITDSSERNPILQTWDLLLRKRKQSHYERIRLLKHETAMSSTVDEDVMFHLKPKDTVNNNELSKKQILLRMEDDREAHKRSKEHLWVVDRPKESTGITESEFRDYYWTKYDKLSESDERALMETLVDFNHIVADSYKDEL